MPSCEPPHWRLEPAPDPALAAALAAQLDAPPAFAALLLQRGVRDAGEARHFLRITRRDLHDPALLPDLDRAAGRLHDAVRLGETVLVHGDYDVDGQCAAALMTRVIRLAGGRAVPFLPHRLRDGYDLSEAGVRAAREAGARLILTLDCGTTARSAIEAATAAGIQVIVTDHHLPGPELPKVVALVNPRRADSRYPFPHLCGTGIAWKLACHLARLAGLPDSLPWHFLDLVALATVADLVPLTGENRILVHLGLRLMPQSRWIGLRALLEVAGVAGKTIHARQLGYVVAPRLNAAGRIGDAAQGLRLLLTDDAEEAYAVAAALDRQNTERQALDQRTLDDALAAPAAEFDPGRDAGIVLARDGWHPGVIGIVASRLVERYARPTVLVALDGEVGRGSGRSVAGFDLHAALQRCAGLLERWGGHRMAAGLTLRRDRLDAFRRAFVDVCAETLDPAVLAPTVRVDLIVGFDELTDSLERRLRSLEPTGVGNPAPVFGVVPVRMAGPPRPIGDRHARLTLTDGSASLRAVAFGLREQVESAWRTALAAAGGEGGEGGEGGGGGGGGGGGAAAEAGALMAAPDRHGTGLAAALRLERDTYRGRDLLEARLLDLAAAVSVRTVSVRTSL